MQEDRLLIRRLRRGDHAALGRIYEKYKDDLLATALCLLIDLAAAEDCLHDVFVAFAAGAAEFKLNSSLKGYLATCIANRARDLLRRRSSQAAPTIVAEIADVAEMPGESAAQQLIDREESTRLHEAMAQLPYEQREVITLHIRGEMTFRRIAERQDVSINTVQSRYRYGLDKLRTVLGAWERT